jgi:CheY-like chemotaxis protein
MPIPVNIILNPAQPQGYFTLSSKPSEPDSANPLPHSTRWTSQSKRVLVVDDEQVIADSVVEILGEYGYEALAAYSGNSALELVQQQCPDIIMTDVIMPQMNGVDTAIAIRSICPKARIILFSGQAATADILQTARSAGHDFELLPKPIHPEQLLQKLVY